MNVHRMSPLGCSWPELLRNGLAVVVVNGLIALVLWLADHGPFDQQLIYAQGIGLSIWALIQTGAALLRPANRPERFPQGWRLWLLMLLAVPMGVVVGVTLGDGYAQRNSWSALWNTQRSPSTWWMLALGVSVGTTALFYLWGRGQYFRAAWQTAQRQKAETQLRLLESQLEPHMLFNTLANLRVLIELDPPKAQHMLDHLIGYLRSTLDASRSNPSNQTHTLANEFNRLRDYLEIMAIRMGPRLNFELHLPAHLAQTPIPALLLQPLVENAIRHGLEPHIEGGQLRVSAQWQPPQTPHSINPMLVLTVQDQGVGLDASPSTPSSGFGLHQVRERLLTVYGPSAQLVLTREEGWTLAEIRLPLPAVKTHPRPIHHAG